MSTPDLSPIPAEAGNRRTIGLDYRLRGNDWGVGFIRTDNGIFVAVAGLIRGAKIGIAVNIMKDLADALPPLAGWHLIIPV